MINALLLLSASFLVASENTVFYGKNNFEEAKIKANQEGKLLFLDFYAKWCTPCKWMDETTFRDDRVIEKLSNNFVSIKIDIDDMEGFELKSRFDVMYLPTILIFNVDGKMIERVEETLSPTKMVALLDKKLKDNITEVQLHPINTSPKSITQSNNDDGFMLSQAEYRQYFADTYVNTKEHNAVYQIQLGVYANFDGAVRRIEELQKIFLEDFSIFEEIRDNKKFYKILMGKFESKEDAESFKKLLKTKHNIEAIIY